MGEVVNIDRRERVAHDVQDQRDRAEHYERIYRKALTDIRLLIATGSCDIEVIEDIAKGAIDARW